MGRFGICKLCLESRELRDSHLLPKAGYRVVSKSQGGQSPLVMKPQFRSARTNTCALISFVRSASRIFSRSGEAWVLKNCYQGEKEFALKGFLDQCEPVYRQGERFKVYASYKVREIDSEKLTYFAASVFWKGSLHDWKSAGYQLKLAKLGRR